MENNRRVDANSGAVIFSKDSPEVQRRKLQARQMDALIQGMNEIKNQVASLTQEVRDIKQLMLDKTKS